MSHGKTATVLVRLFPFPVELIVPLDWTSMVHAGVWSLSKAARCLADFRAMRVSPERRRKPSREAESNILGALYLFRCRATTLEPHAEVHPKPKFGIGILDKPLLSRISA
jgi:hypothetical protein